MDKYTGFHIAIGIDMAITPTTSNAPFCKFTIILEVNGIQLFTFF